MSDYRSKPSNGKGFRMVYRFGNRWRWHANVTVKRVPPRLWHNDGGWTRWKWWGIVRSFAAYFKIWAGEKP